MEKDFSNCWEHFTELRWHSREIARYTRIFSSAREATVATLLALRLNLKHCQAYETVATIGSQEQVLITNSYLYAMKLNDLVVLILDYTFHMLNSCH